MTLEDLQVGKFYITLHPIGDWEADRPNIEKGERGYLVWLSEIWISVFSGRYCLCKLLFEEKVEEMLIVEQDIDKTLMEWTFPPFDGV